MLLTLIFALLPLKAICISQGLLQIGIQHTLHMVADNYSLFSYQRTIEKDENLLVKVTGGISVNMSNPFDGRLLDAFYTTDLSQVSCYKRNRDQFDQEMPKICKNICPMNNGSFWDLRRQYLIQNYTFLEKLSGDADEDEKKQKIQQYYIVLDNTKYPCDGTFYPDLQLVYQNYVLFEFQYTYFFLSKALALLICVVFIVQVTGIIVLYFKLRRQNKKNIAKEQKRKMIQNLNHCNSQSIDNIDAQSQSPENEQQLLSQQNVPHYRYQNQRYMGLSDAQEDPSNDEHQED